MNTLCEGLQYGDLVDLLSNKIHVDEYKSKMGSDDQIIVLTFKVKHKNPAFDLINFIETGYDYVLDADISTGEIAPNQYLVFVEIPRRTRAVDQILEMLSEIANLVENDIEWVIAYGPKEPREKQKYYPVTKENLELLIPLSPKEYRDIHDSVEDDELEQIQMAAGVNTNKKAPNNDELNALRAQAGQL